MTPSEATMQACKHATHATHALELAKPSPYVASLIHAAQKAFFPC